MTTIIGNCLLKLSQGARVFSQGTPADAMFLIETGKVQITVVSAFGKKAILRVLGPDDFLGEECMVGGSFRKTTATSLEASTVFRIETAAIVAALRVRPELCRKFVASLLARSLKLERDLCGEFFSQNNPDVHLIEQN
jgi:CRP/FNR family transcriptional regulator, cyclic AMP receptor protein